MRTSHICECAFIFGVVYSQFISFGALHLRFHENIRRDGRVDLRVP